MSIFSKAEGSEAGPFRHRWPLVFALLCAALVCIHFLSREGELGQAVRDVDIVYGFMALGFSAALFSYWIRSNVFAFRLGSRHGWYVSHLYIGALLVLVVYLHSGFRFTGVVSGTALTLFWGSVVTGTLGAVMYRVIPLGISKNMSQAVTEQEISARLEKILEDADSIAQKAPVEFMDVYAERIRSWVAEGRWMGRYLFWSEREAMAAAENKFDRLKSVAPEGFAHDMEAIRPLFMEKEKLMSRLARIRIMRLWLTIHWPLSAALLVSVILHALSIAYY